jgi:NAD(P)-dependent dehydrogenase (short-subunit alcohol dehydrogenase family)
MILAGKTVVVSGVGAGLGREVATLAIRDGANLVLGARTESQLERVAREVDPSGKRVAFVRTDIRDDAQCEGLAELAMKHFGRLDALVQVAALDTAFGGLRDGDLDDFQRTSEVNVVGSARMVKAVAPRMQRSGGGSIVLIGAQASFKPMFDAPQMAYAASKAALGSMMYYLARELGPDRIRVNTVVPTWMWGDPVEGYVNMKAEQEGVDRSVILARITSRMAIPEIPQDADVAEAAIFLCSDRARLITGQYLMVNSGELMT